MSRVAITGSSGFVGSNLVRAFASDGWEIVRLDRPAYDLGHAHAPSLGGIDALIHCARSTNRDENVAGSRRLFQAARDANVRSIVFISSLSACDSAVSAYGREKFEIEQLLDPRHDVIVRPGLVIGDGGLYAAMARPIRRFGMAPLVDGGTQPVYTIAAPALANAIRDIVCARARGLYLLAHPQPTTLRELYNDIAARAGVRLRLVPAPYNVLLAAATVAQTLRLPLPLSPENVRGVRNLRFIDIPRYAEIRYEL